MRVITLLALLVLPFPALAQCDWDTLQPGEWCAVPGSALQDAVDCSRPEFDCSGPNVLNNCLGSGDSPRSLANIMEAWSGGAYDPVRGKLVVFGGGHADYCGNEIWEFDVNTLRWEYSAPSSINMGGNAQACVYGDGRPRAIHSYSMPFVEASTGRFCTFGTSACFPSGNTAPDDIWCNSPAGRDPSNNSGLQGWAKLERHPENTNKARAEYNTADGLVYFDGGILDPRLRTWNPANGQFGLISASPHAAPNDDNFTGAIDPVNDAWVLLTGNKGGDSMVVAAWDLNSGVKTTRRNPPSCNARAPGIDYDSTTGKFTLWCGGSKTYQYDYPSDSWDTCNASAGSPPSPLNNGTYGRFAYVPSKNGYVLANSTSDPVYLYRLPETCAGVAAVECADGLDNDGDGQVDLGDAGCASAADTDETNCSDGVCEGGEDVGSCPSDCSPPVECGDGVCSAGETPGTCPADCSLQASSNVVPGATLYDPATPSSIGYRIPIGYAGGVATDSDYDSTVTVRYREAGGSWAKGVSPDRIRDAGDLLGNAVPPITEHFGGALWSLRAGTTYEIEFTITDPDGFSETRVDTTRTADAPPARPGSADHTVSSLGALRELLDGDGAGDAAPGELIVINANLNGDSRDSIATINVSGEAGNPIFVACSSRDIVLDANGNKWVFELTDGTDYVHIENCTLTGAEGPAGGGADGFQIKGRGSHTGIVIRQNMIRASFWINDGEFGGIDFDSGDSYGIIVTDNFIEGPISFPIRRTSRTKGIKLQGQAITISRNVVRGFGDNITFSDSDTIANRNVVVFGNDSQWSKDDCIQADYVEMGIIHNNRCTNYGSCVSTQPTEGGPIYFTRNVCWSGGMTRHLKIDGGPGERVNAQKIWNNLLTIPWTNYSSQAYSMEFLNNLWVGANPPTENYVIDSSMGYFGLHEGANGDNSPDAIWDHNAYNYNDGMSVGTGGGGSFATWQANTGYDAHGQIISEPLFATSQAPYPDSTDRFAFYSIPDPRPHASSSAIDAGVEIPGVTNASPDIGPYELGDPLYPYGLETWSYTAGHCNDGIDNDRDGLIDLADSGCSDASDPSEKGSIHVCDNGIDEDNDKHFDYPDDPQCSGPTDGSEDESEPPSDPPAPPTNVRVD